MHLLGCTWSRPQERETKLVVWWGGRKRRKKRGGSSEEEGRKKGGGAGGVGRLAVGACIVNPEGDLQCKHWVLCCSVSLPVCDSVSVSELRTAWGMRPKQSLPDELWIMCSQLPWATVDPCSSQLLRRRSSDRGCPDGSGSLQPSGRETRSWGRRKDG